MANTIQNLREQRSTRAKDLHDLLDKNPGEKWSADHQATYDAGINEINAIEAEIKRTEAVLNLDADQAQADAVAEVSAKHAKAAKGDKSFDLFNKWMRGGDNALSASEWADVRNTMSTTTQSEGGYSVPSMISGQLYDAMKAFGVMRAVADVIRTADGRALSFPTSDGTSEVGEIIAQNVTATAADPSFSTVALPVYKYSSKIVAVPFELLQDSTIDVEAFVRGRLAQRLGRIGNQHFTTGTGSGQPNGVMTAATIGKTGTTGQTATIIYDDLVDLIHSVDPAYRYGGRAIFTTNDGLVKVIRKIKDSQNMPIWRPSFDSGVKGGLGVNGSPNDVFDTLLGYPLYVNNDIASPAANALTMSFGDHSYYKIRDAMDVQMFRFTDSAYTKLGQVAFLAWCRMGGNLMDAGAVKTYKHSAT